MKFTYGAELEIPDWNCKKYTQELEKTGASRNLDDYTIINSSGVSNDPSLKSCIFGGEINTKPTDSIQSQIQHISDVLNAIGNYGVNHSQNLHLHIRIPGLYQNPDLLKKFSLWIYEYQEVYCKRFIYPELENQTGFNPGETEEFALLRRKFHNRRKQSRMRILYPYEVEGFKKAKSPQEWYNAFFAKNKEGKNINHTIHRQFINMTALKHTETIEFRFFSFENNLKKLENAFGLVLTTCEAILNDKPATDIPNFDLPRGVVFDPELEKIGKITKLNKGLTKKDYETHIINLKILLRDGIIKESDLGINLYEEFPGDIPEGDLIIPEKKTKTGTNTSIRNSLEKQNIKYDIW